jgi:starch synthase (maltosyl-transferring)
VQLPLADWGFSEHDTVEVHDLLSGERYFWRGAWNYVRLEPGSRVAHILHVQLRGALPELPPLEE